MQELQILENTPALLKANFAEMKAAAHKMTEDYKNVVVSADSITDGRKMATELNKLKTAVMKATRDAYKSAIAPADDFLAEGKETADIFEQARQSILAQVARFDQEACQKVRELLQDTIAGLWEALGVTKEFRSFDLEANVKPGYLTNTGKLTKAARTAAENAARDNKALQDQTEKRLLMLENQSYKAGLTAPLCRHHVETFLFWSEEEYQKQLDAILAAEVQRQKVTEAKARELHQEEIAAQQAAVEPAPVIEPAQAVEPEPEPAPLNAEPPVQQTFSDGKVSCTVTATFVLTVDARIPNA